MSINTETLNRRLFKILAKYKPVPLDVDGNPTDIEDEADVFKFTFTKDSEPYGTVYATIDNDHALNIYYGDDVTESPSGPTPGLDYDDSWTGLLRFLKQWAMLNQLSWQPDNNKDHLTQDMARRKHMKKKEQIAEGYYAMGKKASYSDAVPTIKIVIEHTRQIEEGEQRYRNVNRIFLENEQGERILAPTTRPGVARVYARHLAEGGLPHDDRWNHIVGLCEEYNKMAGFVRATRNGQFNESTQRLVATGIEHYQKLRESLSKMTGKRGYTMYFENWTPSLMEDEETLDLSEMFVQETLDPRIESVMPILSKLHKTVAEMKEVDALSEWADSLLEGGDGGEASDEGAEGDDIGDEAAQAEEDLTEEESLTSNNPQGIPEGEDDDAGNPVSNAIMRRILAQRLDLLSKHGPERLGDAIANVADFVGDVDEIGSSDVSGWVKQVERELSDFDEGDLEHELERQDYEHDRERDEQAEKDINEAERPGLWANIHAKRERIKHGSGERMRKPGSKGAPTAQNFRDAAKEGVGDVAKKVAGALKTGAKAVGKTIVGKDDEELLRDLKKRAGVNNPESGKPSMAHSGVEKRNELDEIDMNTVTHAINALNPVTGALIGAAAGKGLEKAADWYQKRKEKKALEKQKGVAEDLDANQKRVGQLGPTEKVKNNNIGKLVGANENFINTDAQAVVTEEEGRPYVCVHAKKGQCDVTANSSYEAAQKAAKKWGLKSTAGIDAHLADEKKDPASIAEGQEDLDAILRIIRK